MTAQYRTLASHRVPVSSSFLPTDIAGIRLWLRSETLDALTDGNSITTWSDSSGNAYNAAQTDASRKPTKQTISGKSAALFDGSDDALTNSTMPAIGSGDFTAYIVMNVSNNNTIFNIGNGSGSNALISRVGGSLYINPQGSGANVTDGAITGSTTQLLRVYRSSGTTFAQRYGTTESSGSLTMTTDAGFVVGDYWAPSAGQPINGYIMEIVLYGTNISAGNKTSVESYLVTKYGL